MTAARLDNGNEFPTIEKIDTKWVLSLDKTSDVPMYFFENKEFKEFTITRN